MQNAKQNAKNAKMRSKMRKMRRRMSKMRRRMSKMRTQCEDAWAKCELNAKTLEQNANSMRRRMSKMRNQCEDAWAKCEDAYPKGTLIYAARLAFLGHDSCICYGIFRKLFTSILHRLPIDLTSTSPWPYIHLTFTSHRLFRDKLVYGQVVWLTYWVLSGLIGP
jgi:hypothetical protein